eukprot:TRINITY_DN457_c0_g1_i1.p1 TRINITY_DN457_c0_g1~~TRINITY_DN457_c0_g1_i1.p1  ORF type:complete len:203 (+),score=37.97 TRINITY_DN457_c0_g1_i1:42-650(+)
MSFSLPPLPYAIDALAPHISKETLEFHHGKHHNAYVVNLNKLVAGTEHAGKTLEQLILTQKGPIFNNAGQIWNHTFYWHSMAPAAAGGGGLPSGALKAAIDRDFGSFEAFKEKFTTAATTHFGSGWAWLVADKTGKLQVVGTHDAGNPLTDGLKPLLTIDIWEHAYYIDYRNARATFVDNFWKVVNWQFAQANLASPVPAKF